MENIHFMAHHAPHIQQVFQQVIHLYGQTTLEDCTVVVALGGDGFMLEALHRALPFQKPIYGMNQGTLAFLMNDFHFDELPKRLFESVAETLYPLEMEAYTETDDVIKALAFNEVSVLRQTRQAAKLTIKVDDKIRLEELVCDGIMLATPAGSTAYNLSAHGPILPIDSNILALTPISAFRPRRWRGALLPHSSHVCFEVRDIIKRPVSATADHIEVRNIKKINIYQSKKIKATILFDHHRTLAERVLNEQFES